MVDFISANSAVQAHLCLLVKLADIGMRAIGTVGQSRAAGAITLMSVRYCPFEKHQESTLPSGSTTPVSYTHLVEVQKTSVV
ncbi:hypothetical protein T4E_193 [Trichinella pseudospiralis]|uniref:Uncharacterized protein n=1 Tax=Trichinella pseudospiralis TaxID=6337 RepID=A0A0V0YCP8_TRIPS|nr:hypothetical protein T4E_193 [Trichinella pseudospiralis]